jgi:hypothetical protein
MGTWGAGTREFLFWRELNFFLRKKMEKNCVVSVFSLFLSLFLSFSVLIKGLLVVLLITMLVKRDVVIASASLAVFQ